MTTLIPDLEAFSDNSLMTKVRDGEIDRLGLLFERYKKPLYGFFYGMNRDGDLSEDLVQNTFFRIMKYRHLFRGDGDFRTWMFHIARNVNNDHYRKNKLNAREKVEKWEGRLGHDENRSAEMVQEDEHTMLDLAMARLPDDKREVLLLSKYEDKKYKEIGEILGCSEGAVKVKVFRALQELKEIYTKLEAKM